LTHRLIPEHELAQTFPHRPQLSVSLLTSLHAPEQQGWPGGQTRLHPPQFCGSVLRFLQMPAQSVIGGGQMQLPS
jgi:hypothetical protein